MDFAIAQKSSMLQGKWKFISISEVISTSRDSLYYDLEKDSIYIPTEDLKEAYKDGHDSISTANIFKSMYGSFKGASFIFEKDSVVFEFRSTKAKGTYQIKNNDTLEMLLIYEDKEQAHLIYTYSFKGDLLNILLKTDMGYSKFILKKE
jgi:hypothetical protein